VWYKLCWQIRTDLDEVDTALDCKASSLLMF